jgi:hypothetical protein
MRVPAEPLAPLRRAAAAEGARVAPPLYAPWIALLRRRARRAGLAVNDHLLGLAWSGAMTEPRVLRLLAALPPGVTELYGHPAMAESPALPRGYRPVDEFAALTSPAVKRLVAEAGIVLAAYGDVEAPPP